jgi:catechol 2,3-dioxygenase-like lactoylglutathione lyase family enzyme
MKGTRFDHIAIGMERMAGATDFLVGRLGGVPDSGGPGGGFRWAAWTFAGGGCIEVIEPAGADGFLHRFLAARGPGLHHVTFKVSSLADAAARAEAQGYRLVGRDEADPDWLVAYLHPKEALGVVVQLGQSGGRYGRRPGEVPPGPAAPPPPARVLGLRTRARSAERARLQWERALGGTLARATEGELVFRWPGSPMRIVAEIVPDADEGPLAIELGPEPPLPAGLPPGPVPRLGTVFLVDRRPNEVERGLTDPGI